MKIIAAYDDPGGGLAVTTVLKNISAAKEAEIVAYSGSPSRKLLAGTGILQRELCSDLSNGEALAIIMNEKPDILLTATGGGRAEQELRNIAYERELRSVVILDFWKHYARRWEFASYRISEMKDNVMVMDENAKREMLREGFPEERLLVTGHPYLDKIFNLDPRTFDNAVNAENFLFLSQPAETIELNEHLTHPLLTIGKSLEEHARHLNRRITLFIRLHPLEEMSGRLQDAIDSIDKEKIRLVPGDSEDGLDEMLAQCNTVIGFNTIAMFEAAARGKRVFSLDIVPMNESLRTAMSQAGIEIIRPEDLMGQLSYENKPVSIVRGFHKGAIDNCVRHILAGTGIQQTQST